MAITPQAPGTFPSEPAESLGERLALFFDPPSIRRATLLLAFFAWADGRLGDGEKKWLEDWAKRLGQGCDKGFWARLRSGAGAKRGAAHFDVASDLMRRRYAESGGREAAAVRMKDDFTAYLEAQRRDAENPFLAFDCLSNEQKIWVRDLLDAYIRIEAMGGFGQGLYPENSRRLRGYLQELIPTRRVENRALRERRLEKDIYQLKPRALPRVAPPPEFPPWFAELEKGFEPAEHGAAMLAELVELRRRLESGAKPAREMPAFADMGSFPFEQRFAGERGGLHLLPAGTRPLELIVIGDLHGAWANLKAILAESRFFHKVAEARRSEANPDVRLVFLGDYFDRGLRGFDGVLRALVGLMRAYPENVIALHGNHEDLEVLPGGEVVSGCHPADTLEFWTQHLAPELLAAVAGFYQALPRALIVDRMLFAHGGIPAQLDFPAFRQGWRGFLNPEVQRALPWSDPADKSVIDEVLQKKAARFEFNRAQFDRFCHLTGIDLMVRGHQDRREGFLAEFGGPGLHRLFTVFSAGGADHPEMGGHYDQVDPHWLSIAGRRGSWTLTPWRVDWKAFATPQTNGFLKASVESAS